MCIGVQTIVTRPDHEATWHEMIGDGVVGKAFVYYSRNSRRSINRVAASSVVYIYHTDVGFIGKGEVRAEWEETVVDDGNVKLSVPLKYIWALPGQTEWERVVKARQINDRMQSTYRFRHRVFKVRNDLADTIDEIARENGVLFHSE